MQYYFYTLDVAEENPIELRDMILQIQAKLTIFDLDKIICENQLKMALIRTSRAEKQNRMIAKVWGIEVILHIAATHQIAEALDLVGISPKTRRIGIISPHKDLKMAKIIHGVDIQLATKSLVEAYGLNGLDPCSEIISKGVMVLINHQ